MPFVNMQDYTLLDHLLFGIGCFLWVIVYILVLINIRKFKFVEIPMIAVTVNFAWETLWSWTFVSIIGMFVGWGYRSWFFLDCFIVFYTLKYGYKQLQLNVSPTASRIAFAAFWVAWLVILYFFSVKFDVPQSGMGGYGGYWCNLIMSSVYITLLLRTKNLEYFSVSGAWLKGLGTFLVTLFCINHAQWKGEWFLYSLGIATALLDAVYICTLYWLKKKQTANVSMG